MDEIMQQEEKALFSAQEVETEEKEAETALCDVTESSVKRPRRKKVSEVIVVNMYGKEVSLKGADVHEFEEKGKRFRKWTKNGSFVHIEEMKSIS